MKILKNSIFNLAKEGKLIHQIWPRPHGNESMSLVEEIEDRFIIRTSVEGQHGITVPYRYMYLSPSKKQAYTLHLSYSGWLHFREQIKQTFLSCSPEQRRGTWEQYEEMVENFFDDLDKGTVKYIDKLTRKLASKKMAQ